ncbi:hypothetical protein CHUAL_002103 [Chamberlinius hualienensis]
MALIKVSLVLVVVLVLQMYAANAATCTEEDFINMMEAEYVCRCQTKECDSDEKSESCTKCIQTGIMKIGSEYTNGIMASSGFDKDWQKFPACEEQVMNVRHSHMNFEVIQYALL